MLSKQDKSSEVIGIVGAFTAFSIVCVAARVFTRLRFTGLLGPEDVFILISIALSIAMGVCQIQQARWGNGKHFAFLSATSLDHRLKYLYFSVLIYNLALTFTRLSILLQYRRIFGTSQKVWVPIYVMMGLCIAYAVESTFVGLFNCIPVDAFWNVGKRPTATCINIYAWYYANAGLNVALDLLTAALPVRSVWRLHISKKQKIALVFILTIGWIVCIVSILRLHALVVLGHHSDDNTWYGAAPAYYSNIEVNLAIVCASLPALKPLIARVAPVLSTRYGSNTSRHTYILNSYNSRLARLRELSQRTMGDSQFEIGMGNGAPSDPCLSSDINYYLRESDQHSPLKLDSGVTGNTEGPIRKVDPPERSAGN